MAEIKQGTFNDLLESQEPVRVKDGWYHNDMIFVEYGSAYAIADTGATVCLGPMPEVEIYLKSGINKGLHPVVIEILDSIKKLEAEIDRRESVNTVDTKLRTPGVKQRNNIRIRLVRNLRNNSKHFKPTKASTKLTLHPVRP